MKKVVPLLFFMSLFLALGIVSANVCSDPSQVIFKVNQSNGGYVTAGNLNYPSFGKFGDVNLDGFVDISDVIVLNEFLLGVRGLEYWGEKLADVNLDGFVDVADLVLLSRATKVGEGSINLPIYFENEVYQSEILWGDANRDGVVNLGDVSFLEDYFRGDVQITKEGMRFADVNLDGVVTAADSSLIAVNVSGLSAQKLPQYQGVYVEPVFGDVTFDGNVYVDDLVKISTFIYRNNVGQNFNFDKYSEILADVNLDGVVDSTDLTILSDFLGLGSADRKIESIPIYFESVGIEIQPLWGDANADGIVNLTDAREINFRAESLPKYGEILADVNLDGVVGSADANLITLNVSNSGDNKIPQFNGKYVEDYLPLEVCYDELFGKTYEGEKPREDCNEANTLFSSLKKMDSRVSVNPLYGDVNLDGEVRGNDVDLIINHYRNVRSLEGYNLIMADVDLDGDIDKIDSDLVLNASLGIARLPYKIGTSIKKVATTKYGDLNSDDSVDVSDLILMSSYLVGNIELSPIGKKMADVQVDGEINVADHIRLSSFLLGEITSLPYEGESLVNSPLVFGDVTGDGLVDLFGDHVLLHQYLLGQRSLTNYQKAMADVNLDGFVDGGDLMLIHFNQNDPSLVPGLPVSYEYINSPISVPTFTNNICYGDLMCDIEKSSGNSCENGGEIVARLENLYDSRVSIARGSTLPYKVCCRPVDAYWAKLDGTPITEADMGDTVKMVISGRGSDIDSSTQFRIIERDWNFFGLLNLDKDIEYILDIENEQGNAVGYWSADRGLLETKNPGNYNNFIFMQESWGIESEDLKINEDADNSPIELEILSPSCGMNYSIADKSKINISFSAKDLDDLLSVRVTIKNSDTGNQLEPYEFENVHGTINISDIIFNLPGSYSIVVEAFNSRNQFRRAVSNIMITSPLLPYTYAAACITSPQDSDKFALDGTQILFDGSTSRVLNSSGAGNFTEISLEDIFFNWTIKDSNSYSYVTGIGNHTFTRYIGSEGNGWVNLEVSV